MAYQQAADRYLRALGSTLPPDMVRGVYVVGSAALGSWRPGRSDLDVLVVLDRPMTDSDLAMTGEMHAVLEATRAGGPHCDGHYVTPDLLGARSEARVPFSVDGAFKPEGQTTDPVLWAILDQYGVTLRGPRAAELKVGPDPVWLREWNHENLESYWRDHVSHRSRFAKQEP